MIIQRLSHIGICVSDLEKSIAFYCDVLGFELLSKLDVKGKKRVRSESVYSRGEESSGLEALQRLFDQS